MPVQMRGHIGGDGGIVEPGEAGEQLAHLILGQRIQDQELRFPLATECAGKLPGHRGQLRRPVGSDHQEAGGREPMADEVEHLETWRIGPVDVVHHEEDRALYGHGLDALEQRLVEPPLCGR
jgi:hypothetical protein